MTALVLVVLAATDGGTPVPDERARGRLFDTLVSDIRRLNVFTPQIEANLGRKWDEDLPALKDEMLRADSTPKLGVALTHLANALHNPHVYWNAPARPTYVSNGARLEPEWKDGNVRFYVSKPVGDLRAGDILLQADGEDGQTLLLHHAAESNMNQWRGIARGLAKWLCTRTVMPELGRSTWVVQGRDGSAPRTVNLGWTAEIGGGPGGPSEHHLEYESARCAGLPERKYGPILARGQNYCLYTGKPGYPVLRHFSFNYSVGASLELAQHAVRADHENLARALSAVPNMKGLVVDLRDNNGGNNPNWMLDWYAPGPYVDRFVKTELPLAKDEARVLPLLGSAGGLRSYQAALKERKESDTFAPPRTFFCKDDDCNWDNRYEPLHPVAKVPVALLVGPGCISSCDSLVLTFKENDFGPIVGEPTAAAYTTQRINWPVMLSSGQQFGFIALAFSDEVSGKTGQSVEAVPVEPTKLIEPSFENAGTYDGLLLDGAIAELEARAKAKH